ncbi:MAG TPA: sugar transferase [Armatimonadetes bacterium]|nr:sugar transferase [Armatimonadota bacterium]
MKTAISLNLGSQVWRYAFPAVRWERLYEVFRRGVDLLVALGGGLLALPLMLLIAVLIKLDSPGPVIYAQERVGQNRRRSNRTFNGLIYYRRRWIPDRRHRAAEGRPFVMYKFRTMRQDAEKETGPVWATEDDPRTTRVGRFLRKTRLDELPQLFNLLKGDMTLIGPRPERPYFVEKLKGVVPNYLRRLEVKPGITGLAQVRNGYDRSLEDVKRKVENDLYYIEHRSPWLDLSILVQTVLVVLTGRGAC